MVLWHSLVDTTKAELIAVPNGGKRNPRVAAMMKLEGVKAGVPDLIIIMADGRVVWVEVKLANNPPWHGRTGLSEEQKPFHAMLTRLGHAVHVVRSQEEFYSLLLELRVPLLRTAWFPTQPAQAAVLKASSRR